MSRLFRLDAVLRARQAQEDAAKAEVVRVRRAARRAADLAERRESALQESEAPTEGVARAVAAMLAARQALAADLSMARQLLTKTEREIEALVRDLAEKAKARRVVEKLVERQVAEERRLAEAAEQRTLDELAATAPQRTIAAEVPEGVR